MGFGESSVAHLVTVFKEICHTPGSNDGIEFDENTLRAEQILTLAEYGGVRISLRGKIGTAVVTIRIDVGYGDPITPPPKEATYPSLLEMPAPVIRVYPQETVIAEKSEAIVKLGMLNTRFKDYFDLHVLASRYDFDGQTLSRAMAATFTQRGTPIPSEVPVGLSAEFAQDVNKQTQWNAFCQKGKVARSAPPLTDIVDLLAVFLLPPLIQSKAHGAFRKLWHSGQWS